MPEISPAVHESLSPANQDAKLTLTARRLSTILRNPQPDSKHDITKVSDQDRKYTIASFQRFVKSFVNQDPREIKTSTETTTPEGKPASKPVTEYDEGDLSTNAENIKSLKEAWKIIFDFRNKGQMREIPEFISDFLKKMPKSQEGQEQSVDAQQEKRDYEYDGRVARLFNQLSSKQQADIFPDNPALLEEIRVRAGVEPAKTEPVANKRKKALENARGFLRKLVGRKQNDAVVSKESESQRFFNIMNDEKEQSRRLIDYFIKNPDAQIIFIRKLNDLQEARIKSELLSLGNYEFSAVQKAYTLDANKVNQNPDIPIFIDTSKYLSDGKLSLTALDFFRIAMDWGMDPSDVPSEITPIENK